MKESVKARIIGTTMVITIPKRVAEEIHLKAGEYVQILVDKDGLRVQKEDDKR